MLFGAVFLNNIYKYLYRCQCMVDWKGMMLSPQTVEGAQPLANVWFGGFTAALIAVGIVIMLVVIAAVYVYFAFAWQAIARKLKYSRPWMAWIPFANFAMILQMGGFAWWWVFLLIIPILGWIAFTVLLVIATWRIFEKRQYPGWLSLLSLIPKVGALIYLVLIGIVAWNDKPRRA